MPNMNSVLLKTNELLMYHCSCHVNNLATIAIMPIVLVTIVIMPIVPRKDQTKYKINTT